MGRITGRVEVVVNGQTTLNKSGAVANGIGKSGEPSFERKQIMTMNGPAGFVDEPVESSVEVTVTDRDDINLDDFARIEGNGTVIFRTTGGGKVYTLNEVTCTMNFKITSGEGETPLKFIGAYWIETTESS